MAYVDMLSLGNPPCFHIYYWWIFRSNHRHKMNSKVCIQMGIALHMCLSEDTHLNNSYICHGLFHYIHMPFFLYKPYYLNLVCRLLINFLHTLIAHGNYSLLNYNKYTCAFIFKQSVHKSTLQTHFWIFWTVYTIRVFTFFTFFTMDWISIVRDTWSNALTFISI